MLEYILRYPGFIYEISGKFYFLGKWICKECTELDATDTVYMYRMSRSTSEDKETNLYFRKIRAYSDFALEVPYNPMLIKENLSTLLDALSEDEEKLLKKQLIEFTEDYLKYCGEELPKLEA